MNKQAIFAGGCFWCVEHDLRATSGVLDVTSGYVGERESVLVSYDESKTSFKKLAQFFLEHIDPTDAGGQFYDRGEHYKTGIFYQDEQEKQVAENLISELNESKLFDKQVAVQVLPLVSIEKFVKAEDYHQDYAHKNPEEYMRYRRGSGREDFVNQICIIRNAKGIVWKS